MAELVDPDDLDPFDPETERAKQSHAAVKAKYDTDAARTELETRRGAYVRVFVAGTPSQEDREIVLADLHKFCRFNASAFDENDRIHALLSGRQEVALRINDFTSLGIDALTFKYVG